MNEELFLKKLAERAKFEQTPEVDVTQAVMSKISALQNRKIQTLGSLVWFAAFSSLAAVAVGVWAWSVWSVLTDPLLTSFFDAPWGLL